MRAPVTWNGCGLPSSRSAIASPSTTSVTAGRAATASTTSGTRSVISSRLRVNTETSPDLGAPGPGCRRACCRRASSPPPTDATASSAVFADAASIGRTGRPDDEPDLLERRGAATGRSDATSAGGAGEHRGAAHGGSRARHRGGDGLEHDAVERPLPEVAGDEVAQERLLVGGRTAQETRELGPADAADPARAVAARRPKAP